MCCSRLWTLRRGYSQLRHRAPYTMLDSGMMKDFLIDDSSFAHFLICDKTLAPPIPSKLLSVNLDLMIRNNHPSVFSFTRCLTGLGRNVYENTKEEGRVFCCRLLWVILRPYCIPSSLAATQREERARKSKGSELHLRWQEGEEGVKPGKNYSFSITVERKVKKEGKCAGIGEQNSTSTCVKGR